MLKLTWNFFWEFKTIPKYLKTILENEKYIFQAIYKQLEKAIFNLTLQEKNKNWIIAKFF